MHPDIHLVLHTLRAAELRRAATPRPAPRVAPRTAIRVRVGWLLVELGLRLVNRPALTGARLA
ncbi:hypothetical protein [Streptomyces sp. NPDC051569]|uniref:hypothetical protein n=1 Tax=Streptomyces sp. NPDC051569 TaxID=3365661 RepID=UPI0037AC3AC4